MRLVFLICCCLLVAACNGPGSAVPESNVENTSADESGTLAEGPPVENMSADDLGNQVPPFTDPQDRGVGAFATPPPMEVGRWFNVEFLVAQNTQGMKEEAGGKTTEAPKQIYIAPKMRVTLLPDQDFKAVAKTPEVQAIGLDRSATWQWNVSPVSGGDLELTAQVQPLDAKGEVVDTYTKYVKVHAKVGGYQSFISGTKNATGVGDALATLFKSWRETLLALAALIVAAFFVVRVIRNRGSGGSAASPGPPEPPPG